MMDRLRCNYFLNGKEDTRVILCEGKVKWRFWIDRGPPFEDQPIQAYSCEQHSLYIKFNLQKIAISPQSRTAHITTRMKQEIII